MSGKSEPTKQTETQRERPVIKSEETLSSINFNYLKCDVTAEDENIFFFKKKKA